MNDRLIESNQLVKRRKSIIGMEYELKDGRELKEERKRVLCKVSEARHKANKESSVAEWCEGSA